MNAQLLKNNFIFNIQKLACYKLFIKERDERQLARAEYNANQCITQLFSAIYLHKRALFFEYNSIHKLCIFIPFSQSETIKI